MKSAQISEHIATLEKEISNATAKQKRLDGSIASRKAKLCRLRLLLRKIAPALEDENKQRDF